MLQTLSLILSLLSITISVFVIYKSYKKKNEIHDQVIKDVTEHPYLAKAAMKNFPEWKEEIIRITSNHN